jgi:hypothetical protein
LQMSAFEPKQTSTERPTKSVRSHLRIAPAYRFNINFLYLEAPPYAGASARPRSSLSLLKQKSKCRVHVMTNTSERTATKVFGLSLTAVFVGLLILNGISF